MTFLSLGQPRSWEGRRHPSVPLRAVPIFELNTTRRPLRVSFQEFRPDASLGLFQPTSGYLPNKDGLT